eukprot:jgi/Ulvmu1/2149/UM129_0008.1
MITYDKGLWGNYVLFRMYGSAFPRAMPHACLSAGIAATLSGLFNTTGWDLFSNSYPVQMFFFIVGFMVVFRSNLSYNRYWEGRTQLQQMTARLSDAIRTTLNFDRTAVPKTGATPEEVEEHKWFCDTFVHLISLFHGVALATLRGDYNMENLVVHDSLASAPPNNVHMLSRADLHNTDIQESSEDSERLITGARSTLASEAGRSARNGKGGYSDLDHAAKFGFGGQLPRPAKTSKHSRNWAGSKNIIDYFILRTSPDHAQHIYRSMKLPIIGGFTQAEGVALGAFTTSGDTCTAIPDLNLGIHGVMLANGTYAPAPTERVHTIASWIHQCLIDRVHAGGVRASSSIQSRVYQSLADAFVAFEQCQKLSDTPFPFPWVQAVNIALLLFTLAAPVAIVGFINNAVVSTILTFMAVATHVMLNEVASDIEDPFVYDPNELPLPQMQYKLNERLLAVLHSERPVAFTDVGDLTGPGNTVQMREGATGTQAGDDVATDAFDAPHDVPGTSPRAASHKDRITSAANKFAAATAAARASEDPLATMSQAPSRHNTSAGSTFICRSRSPPARGPYMITTPDGMTIPLPQPSSQRSQRSERPTPSDAGDLREYSSTNQIPIATFVRAQRWRLYGGSPTSCNANVGSPGQQSVRSRRGNKLGRVSYDGASHCGSVDSHSTYGAAFVGMPPLMQSEAAYEMRRSMEAERPPAARNGGRQARRWGKGGVQAAAGGKLGGRADSVHGAKVFGFGAAVHDGPQAAAQQEARESASPDGASTGPVEFRRSRTMDGGGTVHSAVRAGQAASSSCGAQLQPAASGAAGAAAAAAEAPQHARAAIPLNAAVRGRTSVRVPHSTQHGNSFGPHEVSLAGVTSMQLPADTRAASGVVPAAVALRAVHAQHSPQRKGGTSPSKRAPDSSTAPVSPIHAALRAGLSAHGTQHSMQDRAAISASQWGTAHGIGSHHQTPYGGTGGGVQHGTQHSTQRVLPGAGSRRQQAGDGADSSSSSSLNTSPRPDTLSFRQVSTTDSIHRSIQHGSQRELPQVSPFGGNAPLPGSAAELMKADMRLLTVRPSKSFSHRDLAGGVEADREERRSASQLTRDMSGRKSARH